VAVFMNEDTIVIALHGSLTIAEKVLAQTPAGAAQVREFHRQLFANGSTTLLQQIRSLTGMEVRDTTVEIEPTTGSVVQVFTTETVGEEFLLAPCGSAGRRDTVGPTGTKVAPVASQHNRTAVESGKHNTAMGHKA
jgi:uncharacterized protein YbcI